MTPLIELSIKIRTEPEFIFLMSQHGQIKSINDKCTNRARKMEGFAFCGKISPAVWQPSAHPTKSVEAGGL